MEDFFTLSSMSLRYKKSNKNNIQKKVPITLLSLKKNLRRSMAYDVLTPTIKNTTTNLNIKDGSTSTDSWITNSIPRLDSKNNVIIISDISSSASEDMISPSKLQQVHCSSKPTRDIEQWITKVNSEHEHLNTLRVKESKKVVNLYNFDDLLESLVNYLNRKNYIKYNNKQSITTESTSPELNNDFNKPLGVDEKSNLDGAKILPPNICSSSISHISETLDDALIDSNQCLLDELCGHQGKSVQNFVLPRPDEIHYKKKISEVVKDLTQTDVKSKCNTISRGAYLDSDRKEELCNTPSKAPWVRRFTNLCDSDSSEEKVKVMPKRNLKTKTKLFSPDKNDKKFPDKSSRSIKTFDIIDSSDKENFSNFAENNKSLENRIRRTLGLDENHRLLTSNVEKKKFRGNGGLKVSKKLFVDNDTDLSKKLSVDIKKKNVKVNVKKKTNRKVKEKDVNILKENSNLLEIHQTKSALNNQAQLNNNVQKNFLASLSGCVKLSQCDPSAKLYRNSYKTFKSDLAEKLFKLFNNKVFDNAIDDDMLLQWNDRMRKTAGFCYCMKITRRTGLIERKAHIVLSTKIVDSADRLRDTLIHEMCHAATWIVNNVVNRHDANWKAWAHKAQQVFPELPPINRCHDYVINTKYTYKCMDCGYSIGRHSKSLNVEKKLCGYCYGKFEILINKTCKDGEIKSVPVALKKQVTGFALFVKRNYAVYKTPQLNHGQVMKVLSGKFNDMKLSKE